MITLPTDIYVLVWTHALMMGELCACWVSQKQRELYTLISAAVRPPATPMPLSAPRDFRRAIVSKFVNNPALPSILKNPSSIFQHITEQYPSLCPSHQFIFLNLDHKSPPMLFSLTQTAFSDTRRPCGSLWAHRLHCLSSWKQPSVRTVPINSRFTRTHIFFPPLPSALLSQITLLLRWSVGYMELLI